MKMHWYYAPLFVCLSLALGVAISIRNTEEKVEVALDLYHFAGDLSVEQRDALLTSPDWKVEASYSPVLGIPAMTASWSKCGFFSLPCLQDDSKDIVLNGSAIHRKGTELRFNMPRYVGRGFFRLDYVSLHLPQSNGKDLSMYLNLTNTNPKVKVSPMILKGSTFLLAGTLSMQGETFIASEHCSDDVLSSPTSISCRDGNGPYGFPQRNRFAFYKGGDTGYNFPDGAVGLRQPLPAELINIEIHGARFYTRQVDSHRIDFVDISGTEQRENCGVSLEYEILYVDGVVVDFSRSMPDSDPAVCSYDHQHIEWGNDGKPLSFGGMRTGGQVTYFSWGASCQSVTVGNYSGCNIPAPTPAQEAEIRAEAKKVREWFLPPNESGS